jgi:hypothetical protein
MRPCGSRQKGPQHIWHQVSIYYICVALTLKLFLIPDNLRFTPSFSIVLNVISFAPSLPLSPWPTYTPLRYAQNLGKSHEVYNLCAPTLL